MFKAATWRSEKNKIKVVFRLQIKATQVPQLGWEAMMVTLVPVDVGKPSVRSEKASIVNEACIWLSPVFETVKLNQDSKTGKISDKVYQFIVSATGSMKSGVLGEISINIADYVEVFKPTLVSLPLQDSDKGAILHVTIHRVQGNVEARETVENGEITKETIENRGTSAKQQRRTLMSQLSNPDYEQGRRASNGTNDNNSTEEGSFINTKAMVKFNSCITLDDDSSGNLRKSSSFDGISASGSESSSGQYTPNVNSVALHDNASSLSHLSNNDAPQNTDWSMSSPLDVTDNTIQKYKSDCDVLARQLEVSELELQTLRKQVMKESSRGKDLSRELSSLKEERDALRKECEVLKSSKKRAADDENASAMLRYGVRDPLSKLEEMKQELDHEKNLNANLRLQLKKTQESNSELIFVVKDLEEMLQQKNRGSSCSCKDSQVMEYENLEHKQQSSETISDDGDEQCELDNLLKGHEDIRAAYPQERSFIDLNSELELYKKDREDLEMQIEQLALDYEILKQENHDISSRLEQLQLRDQLRMQYDCTSHLAIINDLESHVESLEKELEKQVEGYEAHLASIIQSKVEEEQRAKQAEEELRKNKWKNANVEANLASIIQSKVEQEQRAIQAEEKLRKAKWKNANTVEHLQDEFKRLSSQISTSFYANEEIVMRTLEDSRELRLKNCHMGELLEKSKEELSSLQRQHQVKCQQLLSLIDFKTNEVYRLLPELQDTKEELGKQKKSQEATQKTFSNEMSKLKAEMEQLIKEKCYLSGKIEQNEEMAAEIEKLKTSTKGLDLLLQERILERDVLGQELSAVKEEARKSLEELNAFKNLKDEQDATIKNLNSKIQFLATEYTDLKNCLSNDELEKESTRKQVFLLRGDLRKETDFIASMERRPKEDNIQQKVYEVTMMTDTRNKRERLHGTTKHVDINISDGHSRDVHEDLGELNDATLRDNSNTKDDNMNGVKVNGNHLQEKMTQDVEFMNDSYDNYGERIKSDLDVNSKAEVENLVSHSYDQIKIAEVLSEMEELKERNESMEAELKEMQERYSEMSLKFAEVEGERQQLVIRIRSLKHALKN